MKEGARGGLYKGRGLVHRSQRAWEGFGLASSAPRRRAWGSVQGLRARSAGACLFSAMKEGGRGGLYKEGLRSYVVLPFQRHEGGHGGLYKACGPGPCLFGALSSAMFSMNEGVAGFTRGGGLRSAGAWSLRPFRRAFSHRHFFAMGASPLIGM